MVLAHFCRSAALFVVPTIGLAFCVGPALVIAAEFTAVGVAKVDITPQTPVRMYGYAARTTESEGIAGRLKAAALAVGHDDGEGPAVLLSVDCGAVPTDICAEVLRRVQTVTPLKPERFMVCNSHNHSGPNLKGMDPIPGQEHEHLVRYAEELTDRLTQVVRQALDTRHPAQLAWTRGSVDFAANRRVLKDGKWAGFGAVLEGPADHSLPLLRVTDAEGNLMALVINYACHNTTLRGNFKQIHGDWAACAQEAIEEDHPGAIAMVTIGCGADADPNPHGTVDLCERHGQAIAQEVKRLLEGDFQIINGPLTARMTTLEIPFEPAPSLDQLQDLAKRSHAGKRLLKQREEGSDPPVSKSFRIATWTFGGGLAMVFLSDEVVVDYALRLKRELGADRVWISAYTGDVSTYIVSKRLLPEGGYEVNNSLSSTVTYGRPELLDPPMEDRIIAAVRTMLPATLLRN